MLRIALLIAFTLASGMSPAVEARADAQPHCVPLAKVKSGFDQKTTHFTLLSPGQTNFARGGYVATPPINLSLIHI